MNATETIQSWFDHAGQAMPGATIGALIGCIVLGVLIWIAGGKLAKPACVVGGLLLGIYLGLLLSGFVSSAGFGMVLIGGLAIAGGLLAMLLFRVWMGLSTAIMLAIVVPAAVLVWQGTPIEDAATIDTSALSTQLQTQLDENKDRIDETTRAEVTSLLSQQTQDSTVDAQAILQEHGIEAAQALRGQVFENLETAKTWWRDNSSQTQKNMAWGMLGGALLGLLLGMLMPVRAAILQTAFVGGVLAFVPGREIVVGWLPDAAPFLPASPRGALLAIGLITLLGVLLQWTLFFRKVDKEA